MIGHFLSLLSLTVPCPESLSVLECSANYKKIEIVKRELQEKKLLAKT